MILSLQNNIVKSQFNLPKRALKKDNNGINPLLTELNKSLEIIKRRKSLNKTEELNGKLHNFEYIQSSQFLTQIIAQNHFYSPKKIYFSMIKSYQKNVEYSQNFLFQNKDNHILI